MIKCAHCKGRHKKVAEVKACAFGAVKIAPAATSIELIEKQMHEMVRVAELREDAQVAEFKANRDAALLTATKPKIAVTEPGMYRRGGDVFQVIWNKAGTHLYAKLYVPTYVAGKLHKFEFTYDKGAIFSLDAGDRMTVEEVGQLGRDTGWCWVCHRKLTVQKSIEAGIGPVCAKKV